VGRVWTQKVIDASGKRDPTGQLFSYRDRRTVVEFTLDRQGEITDVHVAASSGVQYLDEVAAGAFRGRHRVPHPPPGLVPRERTRQPAVRVHAPRRHRWDAPPSRSGLRARFTSLAWLLAPSPPAHSRRRPSPTSSRPSPSKRTSRCASSPPRSRARAWAFAS